MNRKDDMTDINSCKHTKVMGEYCWDCHTNQAPVRIQGGQSTYKKTGKHKGPTQRHRVGGGSIVWKDGSSDKHLDKCSTCGVDHYEAEPDTYKEVVTKKSYWDHVNEKSPVDDEGNPIESVEANPDRLDDSHATWLGGEAFPPMEIQLLNQGLTLLTDKQREAVDLVVKKGLTEAEAAKQLGISHQAIHARVVGALATIRKNMGVTE